MAVNPAHMRKTRWLQHPHGAQPHDVEWLLVPYGTALCPVRNLWTNYSQHAWQTAGDVRHAWQTALDVRQRKPVRAGAGRWHGFVAAAALM